jgi:hypothetical protein
MLSLTQRVKKLEQKGTQREILLTQIGFTTQAQRRRNL